MSKHTVTQRKINRALSGRQATAPITLPRVTLDPPAFSTLPTIPKDATPEERVAISRIRLKSYGYQPPKRGVMVGEATPQRAAKAAAIVTEEEKFEDGRSTGLKHRRILSHLERMHAQNGIDREQLVTGLMFQRSVALAQKGEGKLIATYEGRFIDAAPKPELAPVEYSIGHIRRVKEAYGKVPSEKHYVLKWLEASVLDDQKYEVPAVKRWPGVTPGWAKKQFRIELKNVLDALAKFYSMNSASFAAAA
jgi:hypothetical protein